MLRTIEDFKEYTQKLKIIMDNKISSKDYKEDEDYENSYLYKNVNFRRYFDIDSVNYNAYIDESFLYKVLLHKKNNPLDVYTYFGYFNNGRIYEYLLKEDFKYTDSYVDGVVLPLKQKLSHKSILIIEDGKIKKQIDKYFYNKKLYMEKLKVVPNEFYFIYDDKKLSSGGTLQTKNSNRGLKLKEGEILDNKLLKEQINIHNRYEYDKYNNQKIKIFKED